MAHTTTWLTPVDGRRRAALVQHSPSFAPQLVEQLSERLHGAYRLIASGYLAASRMLHSTGAGDDTGDEDGEREHTDVYPPVRA